MDFLQTLNTRQREAVLHTEGPLLILAGAGSGKTRVIICRLAHLILQRGLAPQSLLAVTFTNKAADEMRGRVAALLHEQGPERIALPLVSTFHSFCVRLLRSYGAPLADVRPGFTSDFTIYDENDQLAAVKSVYRQVGLDEKFMKARSALSAISQAKNQGRGPEDFYREATSSHAERLAVVFDRYQQTLRQSNALDFDDLLLEAVRLLQHSREVRETVNRRYRYLMVDEYQDTNRPQYDLMRLLVGAERNIGVVGDEDQSIYSWRGADIRNILDFERDFPNAAVIRLEQNYRSTKKILQAAGAVVANNIHRKGKTLWCDADEGPPILFYRGRDGENEALFVADHLHRYLNQNPDSQAAALYRTNAQSRQMEEALRRYGRKYLVVGGVNFYKRAEVKDLIAYLNVAASPANLISLLRVINTPARGIGRTTVEQIENYARDHELSFWEAIGEMLEKKLLSLRAHKALTHFCALIDRVKREIRTKPIDEVLSWLVEETGYRQMLERDTSPEAESRMENIQELVNAAADAASRGEDLRDFLDHAALVSDTDQIDVRAKVMLMTLHSAKGLEFPLVAIIGLEESLCPHSRAFENEGALEEERRLCYVGMTRARRQLLLTCAQQRRRYGGGSPERMTPSRFLREIPAELVEDRSAIPLTMDNDDGDEEEIDLFAEQHTVRRMAGKDPAGLRTYNSAENVASFFAERGIPFSPTGRGQESATGRPRQGTDKTAGVDKTVPHATPKAPARRGSFRTGAKVRHEKWGVGTVMRREGSGEDAKLTVHFPGHGLKKLVVKYADLRAP